MRKLAGMSIVLFTATTLAFAAAESDFHIPFEKYKLQNGMRVVLSRDTAVPVIALYVIYDVGARSEEKGRTGFAHPDYTDYFETMPSNKLGLALWLESDRMRSLAITAENLKDQQEAVKQERRLRFDNEAYNTAIIDKWPAMVFGNFQSSHSLIGSFEDLEA